MCLFYSPPSIASIGVFPNILWKERKLFSIECSLSEDYYCLMTCDSAATVNASVVAVICFRCIWMIIARILIQSNSYNQQHQPSLHQFLSVIGSFWLSTKNEISNALKVAISLFLRAYKWFLSPYVCRWYGVRLH